MNIQIGRFYISIEGGIVSSSKMPTGKRLLRELKKELWEMYTSMEDHDYRKSESFSNYINFKIPLVKAYRMVEENHNCLSDLRTEKEAIEALFGYNLEKLPKNWTR